MDQMAALSQRRLCIVVTDSDKRGKLTLKMHFCSGNSDSDADSEGSVIRGIRTLEIRYVNLFPKIFVRKAGVRINGVRLNEV